MKKRKVFLILTIISAFLILFLSINRTTYLGFEEPGGFDIVKHFLAYFIFAFFIFGATKNFKIAFFLGGTYGLLIEILQFTLPYRSFDVFDIIINYLASFLVFPFSFLSQ